MDKEFILRVIGELYLQVVSLTRQKDEMINENSRLKETVNSLTELTSGTMNGPVNGPLNGPRP